MQQLTLASRRCALGVHSLQVQTGWCPENLESQAQQLRTAILVLLIASQPKRDRSVDVTLKELTYQDMGRADDQRS